MNHKPTERAYPLPGLQTPSLESLSETALTLPGIATNFVEEAASYFQKAIDHAAENEISGIKACNDMEQSVISGFFNLLNQKNLSEVIMERIQIEIRATMGRMNTKDSEIRSANTTRIMYLLDSIIRIALAEGGLYVFSMTCDFIIDLVKRLKKT